MVDLLTGGRAVVPTPRPETDTDLISVLVYDSRGKAREELSLAALALPFVGRCESATSSEEMVARYRRDPPELVFIGSQRATDAGLITAIQLMTDHPTAVVIMFGSLHDTRTAVAAGAIGVRAYLSWSIDPIELTTACLLALTGRLDEVIGGTGRPLLTRRELQALHRIAEGLSNAKIAAELGLSAETVKTHLRGLFRKLQAGDRAHAVAIGIRTGLI